MKRTSNFCRISAAVLLAMGTTVSVAKPFPTRAVTLIIPYVPGGTTDVAARQFAHAFEKALKQPVVVENKPGASGTLGAQALKSAKPDGYTLSLIPLTVFRQPFIQKTNFDPATDFTYLGRISGYMFGVAVRADSPWQTWQDLLDDAKAKPETFAYGTPGPYSTPHITMIQLSDEEDMSLIHVPFKSDGECLPALMGNHVQMCAAGSSAGALVDSGDLRWLNLWTEKRSERWPDTPTLLELDYTLTATSPYGIAGPKNMPAEVVAVLERAIKEAAEDEIHTSALKRQDQDLLYLDSKDYTQFVEQQIKIEEALVEKLGIAKKD